MFVATALRQHSAPLNTAKIDLGEPKTDAKLAEIVEEMADAPGHPKDVSSEQQQPQGEMPAASTHTWMRRKV